MNARTRPPLDVDALAEALRKAGPFAGWNLSDEVLRRDAERIAAAYQPSEASEGSEADSEAAARSSEVDGLREALDEYGAAMREFKYAKGERRRRAARTRWEHAKNRLDAALTGDTGPKVEPEPCGACEDGECRLPKGHAPDARPYDGPAIAGDTGPKVEPEPRGFQYCIHGVSETQECVDCGGFGWTPEPLPSVPMGAADAVRIQRDGQHLIVSLRYGNDSTMREQLRLNLMEPGLDHILVFASQDQSYAPMAESDR